MTPLELKEIREKFNLSQEDIANITLTSIRTVKSWEYGERNISKSASKLIVDYCNGNTQSGEKVQNLFNDLPIEEKLNILNKQNEQIIISQEINRVYLKAILVQVGLDEDLNEEIANLDNKLKKISSN